MTKLADNILSVRERVRRSAERSGRTAEDITLIAVTKTHPPETVREAVENGITDIGENRVQEAEKKHSELTELPVRWHFIGHIQRNKVKNVLRFSSILHSVDSVGLAGEIDKRTVQPVDIFVEINIGEEEAKSGIYAEEAIDFLKKIRKFPNLNCLGLMAIPPWMDDPEDARPYFRSMAEIQREVNRMSVFDTPLSELSMGMTDDFETAVEEGATMVRVGRAIFGPRKPRK